MLFNGIFLVILFTIFLGAHFTTHPKLNLFTIYTVLTQIGREGEARVRAGRGKPGMNNRGGITGGNNQGGITGGQNN